MTPAEFAASKIWAHCCFNMSTFVPIAEVPGPENITNPNNYPPSDFNPTHLNWDHWLNWAEKIGARGVMLTANHVDGFSLSPTDPNDRKITDSGWYQKNGERNILKEFCDKARARGFYVGIYDCVWDYWWQQENTQTPAAYTAHNVARVHDLLSNYGKIDAILLDGWGDSWAAQDTDFTDVLYDDMEEAVKSYRDGEVLMIVNNHEDGSEATLHGDVSLWERSATSGTPENNEITNFEVGALWDTFHPLAEWFDHVDGTTIDADGADFNGIVGRRYRMETIQGVPVVWFPNFSPYPDGTMAADLVGLLENLYRPEETLIARDNFSLDVTESVGVTLQSHTSNDGTTWTKNFGTADAVIDPYGYARVNHSTGCVYTNSIVPASNDYTIEVEFEFKSLANCTVAAMIYIDGTHDLRMSAVWAGSSPWVIKLERNNAGLTVLASINATATGDDLPAVGRAYKLIIRRVGDQLSGEFWVDLDGGTDYKQWSKRTVTETTVTGLGAPSVYWTGLGSATTGVQIRNFRVTTPDTTAPTPPVLAPAELRGGGVKLFWSGVPDDLWRFWIYRAPEGEEMQIWGSTTASEFFDSNAVPGVRCSYAIKAVDKAFNESALSNIVSATVDEVAGKAAVATQESTAVRLSGDDTIANVLSQIELRLTTGGWTDGVLQGSIVVITDAETGEKDSAVVVFIEDDNLEIDRELSFPIQPGDRVEFQAPDPITSEIMRRQLGIAQVQLRKDPTAAINNAEFLQLINAGVGTYASTTHSQEFIADDIEGIATAVGDTTDPTFVDQYRTWWFENPDDLTAANTIYELIAVTGTAVGFNGLVAMNFHSPQGTSLKSIESVVLDPPDLVVVSYAPSTDHKKAIIQLGTTGTAVPEAGTYMVVVSGTTEDNQEAVRQGRLTLRRAGL